jgi:hypothetical protein
MEAKAPFRDSKSLLESEVVGFGAPASTAIAEAVEPVRARLDGEASSDAAEMRDAGALDAAADATGAKKDLIFLDMILRALLDPDRAR